MTDPQQPESSPSKPEPCQGNTPPALRAARLSDCTRELGLGKLMRRIARFPTSVSQLPRDAAERAGRRPGTRGSASDDVRHRLANSLGLAILFGFSRRFHSPGPTPQRASSGLTQPTKPA